MNETEALAQKLHDYLIEELPVGVYVRVASLMVQRITDMGITPEDE